MNIIILQDDYGDLTVRPEKADVVGQRPRRYRRPPRRRYRLYGRRAATDSDADDGGLSSTAIFIIIILVFVAVAGVAALVASLVIQSKLALPLRLSFIRLLLPSVADLGGGAGLRPHRLGVLQKNSGSTNFENIEDSRQHDYYYYQFLPCS